MQMAGTAQKEAPQRLQSGFSFKQTKAAVG